MSLPLLLEQLGRFTDFALRALPAGLLAWRRPGELARQLHGILLGALPLGLVAGLALGIVVWIHLHGVVERPYIHKVPEYLALAVVLEFAPLGAGLVVAGRTGASLGAELGSMRLTEQIDALEVLGLAPTRGVVLSSLLVLVSNVVLVKLIQVFTSQERF